jgi:signal transduction histidine kinase
MRGSAPGRAEGRDGGVGNVGNVERMGRRGLTTRVALLAGFGGLLALLALSGLDAALVLAQIQARNTAIRRAYLERSRSLERIRAMLYLSGTYVRDYLLDPDAAKAEASRASLAGTRRQIEGDLASYGRRLRRDEAEPFQGLRQELDGYWSSLEPVLSWDPRQRRQQGYSFLRDVVYPRRTGMLNVADRIAAVNDKQLDRGDQELARLFAGFRVRLALTLAATLALGALVAAASMRHILHLEAQTTGHLADLGQARREGQELAARLVETQENERRALARELHDAVGQSLSAVLMELRNLGALLGSERSEPSQPEVGGSAGKDESAGRALERAGNEGSAGRELRSHMATIRGLVEGAVEMVRNMALMLRPSMLDDLGLVPALQWQAREVSRRTGMLVHVAADELPEGLPDEYRTCIYRVAQEALANASKHSQAQAVRITLQVAGGGVRLAVQDDGRGFHTAQVRGLGLLGIQERAANLGGTLQVASEPGRGTLLAVTLPVQAS